MGMAKKETVEKYKTIIVTYNKIIANIVVIIFSVEGPK